MINLFQSIYTTFRYYPLHWAKFYQNKIVLLNAEWAVKSTLCLPIHPALLYEDSLAKIVAYITCFGESRLT